MIGIRSNSAGKSPHKEVVELKNEIYPDAKTIPGTAKGMASAQL